MARNEAGELSKEKSYFEEPSTTHSKDEEPLKEVT